MPILLGAIADDFTGATDLCNTLVRGGMRTVQTIGVPEPGLGVPEADAVVVALKSRTSPSAEAVEQSLAALAWLRQQGVEQIIFKYCSTFDSTEKGNIGPVADALAEALDARIALVCPAFPETGRTIYRGHLFVGDALLSDTHMRDHPLTPMCDSNLVRLMASQSKEKVGLLRWNAIEAGAEVARRALEELANAGYRYAVADALKDEHLLILGRAASDHRLITGGSGIALGLPDNFLKAGRLTASQASDVLPSVRGHEAVLSGSCSAATQKQVEVMKAEQPAFELDPMRDPQQQTAEALGWAAERLEKGPVLIYATAPPEKVRAAQAELGADIAAERVEGMMAGLARGLFERGVRRLVVAGGETSGAVVQALGVRALRIGAQIAPGVPCTVSLGTEPVAMALKSGNFGDEQFFRRALEAMP
jgi:uncharacterized protein YgbK (DUF1537 family)